MKRLIAAWMFSLVLMAGMTVHTMAAESPSGKKDTTVTEDKADKAPKTGESDILIYGLSAAALFSGTAVMAKKKLSGLQ